MAALLVAAGEARPESATPFPPAWDAVIEETFFAPDGEIDLVKLDAYRSALELRRREMRAVLSAHYREQGLSDAKIRKRLERRRQVWVFDRILGEGSELGLLDLLWDEVDPNAARRLASTILELDYALEIPGERSSEQPARLASAVLPLQDWTIERAARAEREASNLWNPESGLFYEPDDLRRMIEEGRDVSRLGPHPGSDFRRAPQRIASVEVRKALYRGGSPLHAGTVARFPRGRAILERVGVSETRPHFEIGFRMASSQRSFKLEAGGETHSQPTVNALLATLGFNANAMLYVRDFRIELEDPDQAGSGSDWRAYLEDRREHLGARFDDFLTLGEDGAGPYLIVKEAVIEAKPRHLLRVGPWPFGGNGNDGMREVRALGLFSVWIGNTDLAEGNNRLALRLYGRDGRGGFRVHHLQNDLGHSLGRSVSEQPGALPWDLVSRTPTGRIRFHYRSLQPTRLRGAITWADARWMAREIAQLRRRQITDAVALGQWPRPLAALLVEKLIERRNQLVEAFDLVGEQTPSGQIGLLRVDRHLTTADRSVVDGELVTGRFEGSSGDFANYWEELLRPVWTRLALAGAAQLQTKAGLVSEVVFDPRSVGMPRGLVAELLVRATRDIEENRGSADPAAEWLSRDTLLLGARLGGGIVGRGEATYYRKYTLLVPAATEAEARFANDTVLNVLLPHAVAAGGLPERYVLVRETHVDARARAITDDLTNGAAFAGADLSFARVRLTRDVISARRGRAHAYRDLSWFDRAAYRAFLKLVFVRIPLAGLSADRGDRAGELYSIDLRSTSDPAAADAAIAAFARDGDARGLDAVADRIELATRFDSRDAWLGLPDLWWLTRGAAHDRIVFSDPRAEEPALGGFAHYERFAEQRVSMLGLGESHRTQVRARTSDAESDSGVDTLTLHLSEDDRDTRSHELEEGALGFINALASADRAGGGDRSAEDGEAHTARIEITPSLHNTNQRWGHVQTSVDIGFSREATDALLALDRDAFWATLGARLGLDRQTLARQRNRLHRRGKARLVEQRRMPTSLRRTLSHAQRMLDGFAAARAESEPAARRRRLADGLALAVHRRGQGFDPRILASLRELIGAEAISVDARIARPASEGRPLMSGVDWVLHTHVRPFQGSRPPIHFRPRSPVELYGMLEALAASVHPIATADGPLPKARPRPEPEDDLLGNPSERSDGRGEAPWTHVPNRSAGPGLPVRSLGESESDPSRPRRDRTARTNDQTGGPDEPSSQR